MTRWAAFSPCLAFSIYFACATATVEADWFDRFGPPADATISDIRKTPAAYLEKVLRIRVRFDSFEQIYNPVYTRFVPESYTNFGAWGEEEYLWKEEVFTNPFPYFFMDKRHLESKTLYGLGRFQPVELLCYIHDYFQGMVWIDVVGIRSVDGGVLNETILRHCMRGMEHFRQRQWDACLREFKDALLYPIPESYAAQIQKDVALVYYYKKGPEFLRAAQAELERAVHLNPDHIFLRRLYLRVREHNRLADEERARVKTRHGDPSQE